MKAIEIISVIVVHFVIPLVGLLIYFRLIIKIRQENIESPPVIDLFLIFVNYGGLLLIILTELFWKWSGMASLGFFYLLAAAPIVMGIISHKNYKRRQLSKYHLFVYKAGLLYFVIMPTVLLILIWLY